MPLKVLVTFPQHILAADVAAYYNDLVAAVKGGLMPDVEITVQQALPAAKPVPVPEYMPGREFIKDPANRGAR